MLVDIFWMTEVLIDPKTLAFTIGLRSMKFPVFWVKLRFNIIKLTLNNF